MKQRLATRHLSLVTLLLFSVACASVQPGNDPVVVDAERTTTVGTDAFDTFLKSEYETRATLRAVSPEVYQEVHSYAEYLRAKVDDGSGIRMARAKGWLKSARALTVAYKMNRTAENKASLQTILATINAAVAETQKYLAQAAAAH